METASEVAQGLLNKITQNGGDFEVIGFYFSKKDLEYAIDHPVTEEDIEYLVNIAKEGVSDAIEDLYIKNLLLTE